jgi:hypothetical protein
MRKKMNKLTREYYLSNENGYIKPIYIYLTKNSSVFGARLKFNPPPPPIPTFMAKHLS